MHTPDHDRLDAHVGRDPVLGSLDPRVTVGLTAAGLVAVLLSGQFWFPLAVTVAAVGRLLLIRVPPGLIVRGLLAPLAVAAVVALRQATAFEGLTGAALLGCRAVAGVCLMLTLATVTPTYQVFAVLSWAGMPRTWVEIAQLMHRHVFTLQDAAREIVAAQHWRLGYSTLGRGLTSAGTLVGMVLERALVKAERIHEALASRGYRGELQLARLGRFTPFDLVGGTVGLVALTLAYLFLERAW